jgi:uncharacterized protein
VKPRSPSHLYLGPSSIEGQGTFTREAIPAGAHVLDCGGILLDEAEVEQAPDDLRVMQVGPKTYLAEDPDNPGVDDFLNHSCEPNLGFRGGALSLFALRDIESGEELLIDYSTCMNEEGWAIPCSCRADTCRGTVRSYCDLSKRDRERLRGIELAYLKPASVETAARPRRLRGGSTNR